MNGQLTCPHCAKPIPTPAGRLPAETQCGHCKTHFTVAEVSPIPGGGLYVKYTGYPPKGTFPR